MALLPFLFWSQPKSESVIGSLALLHLKRFTIITAKQRNKKEERARFQTIICPQWAGPARRTKGKAWRGETYQREPCFLFRHANVPSFCSRRGRAWQSQGLLGGEVWRRKGVVGGGGGCITVFSWNKDSLSCHDKNVFVYVYGEELFVVSMFGRQMWRHSAWWCGATVCLNRRCLAQILWIPQAKCYVKFSRLSMFFFR